MLLYALATVSFIFILGTAFYTTGAANYGAPVDSNLIKINQSATSVYSYAKTWAKEKPAQIQEERDDIFTKLKDFFTGILDVAGLFFSAAAGIVVGLLNMPGILITLISAGSIAVGLPDLGLFIFIILSIFITIKVLLFLARVPEGGSGT
jgi:hypothetical protein